MRKRRPAVVASADQANGHLNRSHAAPAAGNTGRPLPFGACVTVGGEQREAVADRSATASKRRLGGRLDAGDPRSVERAARAQPGLAS